jgi:hypothetical protein
VQMHWHTVVLGPSDYTGIGTITDEGSYFTQ